MPTVKKILKKLLTNAVEDDIIIKLTHSRASSKMKTLQTELKELLIQEEKSKANLLELFKELGYEIEL